MSEPVPTTLSEEYSRLSQPFDAVSLTYLQGVEQLLNGTQEAGPSLIDLLNSYQTRLTAMHAKANAEPSTWNPGSLSGYLTMALGKLERLKGRQLVQVVFESNELLICWSGLKEVQPQFMLTFPDATHDLLSGDVDDVAQLVHAPAGTFDNVQVLAVDSASLAQLATLIQTAAEPTRSIIHRIVEHAEVFNSAVSAWEQHTESYWPERGTDDITGEIPAPVWQLASLVKAAYVYLCEAVSACVDLVDEFRDFIEPEIATAHEAAQSGRPAREVGDYLDSAAARVRALITALDQRAGLHNAPGDILKSIADARSGKGYALSVQDVQSLAVTSKRNNAQLESTVEHRVREDRWPTLSTTLESYKKTAHQFDIPFFRLLQPSTPVNRGELAGAVKVAQEFHDALTADEVEKELTAKDDIGADARHYSYERDRFAAMINAVFTSKAGELARDARGLGLQERWKVFLANNPALTTRFGEFDAEISAATRK